MIAKIGDWVKKYRRELWLAGCSALVAWSAYNVGLIEGARGHQPLGAAAVQSATVFRARDTAAPDTTGQGTPIAMPDHSDIRVFASKNSTAKKYYYSWCSSRVKDANRIWFHTESAAQTAGYTLASGCK